MIEIKNKNKKVLTISDIHLEHTFSRVLAYHPSMQRELFDVFSYPQEHWGREKVAIIKRSINDILEGYLPEYFVSIWVNGEPKNKDRHGSYVIISFFADWDGKLPFIDLINEYLPDLQDVFDEFCVDYDL